MYIVEYETLDEIVKTRPRLILYLIASGENFSKFWVSDKWQVVVLRKHEVVKADWHKAHRFPDFLQNEGCGDQGCQMACFQTKNPNLGKFWRVLQWKMFVYFMSIWSILWQLEIFNGHLLVFCGHAVYFSPFWCIVHS
jgi:hypothetical protein